jgi:N-glycosylase/DNA lyase
MKIVVQIKHVYGNELIYPVCEQARLFADIAGTKTLSKTIVAQIKRLGYAVEVQQKCSL